MQNQNWLCECAIEAGNLAFACQRLEGVRACVSPTTRTFIEATTLLAICHIRRNQIEKAKPLISYVIDNMDRIESTQRRQQFNRRFINRIEEESILASLREEVDVDLDADHIQEEAIKMQILDENSLVLQLAQLLPPSSVKLLSAVRDHAIAALPPAERKFLPAPQVAIAPPALGERVRTALRRVTWRAVCDPSDEIYQAWSKGLSIVYDRKWICTAIIAACNSWKITASMLITTLVALAFKMGVKAFCEVFAPASVMISLTDKK